ncbi:aldose 1-epimerase family protein [Flavobacteriaceae bacterium XHP0103]|uniref:aldose 1-epimerase family protein n=1 Tax=Marixanthotalea marina TaxID=2844359 RepID=UPI002989A467|nr:aldose 1-epimerase family protein [Marixanthotalea marina]MBU3821675.1 aldose 1-epimerase family protein [Marixanthotalea marina]
MYTIQNNLLKIGIKHTGAELCSITSVKNHTEFIWQADPAVWANHAPNLFPIIGALKDNTFFYKGKAYQLPKHGFLRGNSNFRLVTHTENTLTMQLDSDETLLKQYPFPFELQITFKLVDNRLDILHTVKNTGNGPMYFSLGGHPAFKCPVFAGEHYSDYSLVFETEETAQTHLINMENGLISSRTKPLLNNTTTLPLTHKLFLEDALIFKDLKSKKVTLKSKERGDILTLGHPDFEYLGIWAKPNGDYVCIEPWLGIADSETTDQQLTTKEGIIELEPHKSFEVGYSVTINEMVLG